MKYSIVIDQKGIYEAGLASKTDLIDWAIIDYLKSWYFIEPKKIFTTADNKEYIWLNYNHLLSEMPLLSERDEETKRQKKLNKNRLSERIKKLKELGLIETITMKNNTIYFRLSEICHKICLSDKDENHITYHGNSDSYHGIKDGYHGNSDSPITEIVTGLSLKQGQHNNNILNYNIINNNIIEKKEINKEKKEKELLEPIEPINFKGIKKAREIITGKKTEPAKWRLITKRENTIEVVEGVWLSQKEIEKLKEQYGGLNYNKAIYFLSEYKQDKNYKNKNDYLTIRRWVMNAVKDKEYSPPNEDEFKEKYEEEIKIQQEKLAQRIIETEQAKKLFKQIGFQIQEEKIKENKLNDLKKFITNKKEEEKKKYLEELNSEEHIKKEKEFYKNLYLEFKKKNKENEFLNKILPKTRFKSINEFMEDL